MKYITTKLKRYKFLCVVMSVIFLPIRLPLYLIVVLGEVANKIFNKVDCFGMKIIHSIADILKFEEIAKKQYEINKEKFKDW